MRNRSRSNFISRPVVIRNEIIQPKPPEITLQDLGPQPVKKPMHKVIVYTWNEKYVGDYLNKFSGANVEVIVVVYFPTSNK